MPIPAEQVSSARAGVLRCRRLSHPPPAGTGTRSAAGFRLHGRFQQWQERMQAKNRRTISLFIGAVFVGRSERLNKIPAKKSDINKLRAPALSVTLQVLRIIITLATGITLRSLTFLKLLRNEVKKIFPLCMALLLLRPVVKRHNRELALQWRRFRLDDRRAVSLHTLEECQRNGSADHQLRRIIVTYGVPPKIYAP